MKTTTKKTLLGTTGALALALTLGATSASAFSIGGIHLFGSDDTSSTVQGNTSVSGSAGVTATTNTGTNVRSTDSSRTVGTLNTRVNGSATTNANSSSTVNASSNEGDHNDSSLNATTEVNASLHGDSDLENNDDGNYEATHSFFARLSAWFRSFFGLSSSVDSTTDTSVNTNSR